MFKNADYQALLSGRPGGLALKAAFHLTPLVPICFGRPFFTIAMILGVFLAYVKCQKLRIELKHMLENPHPDPREAASLKSALRFWERLCFVKATPAANKDQDNAPFS